MTISSARSNSRIMTVFVDRVTVCAVFIDGTAGVRMGIRCILSPL